MDERNVQKLCNDTANLGIGDGYGDPIFADYREEPPPAPKLNTPGIVATDITKVFREAASKLDDGELIKDEFFHLFDSVGAIELMDPKMDTGFLKPGETMEDTYDTARELSPKECLGIMDELFCLEMSWHMGRPLSQTLFTSLYIDKLLDPKNAGNLSFGSSKFGPQSDTSIVHRVLLAYCLATVKTCSHVNNRVKAEHLYEEEDFVTYTFTRTLLDDVEDVLIVDYVDDVMEALTKDETIDGPIRRALSQRLGFRQALLNTAIKVIDRTDPFGIKSKWLTAIETLPGMKSGSNLSTSVPEAFSEKIAKRLASTVPPRPVVSTSWEEAFAHLEQLCNDGLLVTEVLNFHDSHSLMNFVFFFQKRKPQPSVWIRTILQHFLFGDMIVLGMLSIRTVIDTDLASVTLPGSVFLDQINDEVEVPSDPRHKIARIMERFRRRAAQSYLDILRALCQNRCRIRRTMTHTILDWDVTQLEAEDMDVELRQFTEEEPIVPEGLQPIYSFPLSSWCYHYKLEQMEWLVQMGFELDVYAPDEMASMYYFLQNLAYRHYEHVQRIRGFVLRDYAELRSKPGIENIHLRDEEFQNALRYINLAQLQTTATHSLAQAISLLYTVLERYSLIPKTPHPYSTDEIRYEQRMKPFLSISIPELLPYEIFHASVTQPGEPTTDLIKLASLSVAAAKREYEALAKLKPNVARCEGKWNDEAWHENAKDQVRACIMASLTIATVEKAVQAAVKEGEEKLKLKVECLPAEKSYHDWWVVPKVMPA